MREDIPQLPQYAFIASCLVKHRNNFTFHSYLYFSATSSLSFCIFLPTALFPDVLNLRCSLRFKKTSFRHK